MNTTLADHLRSLPDNGLAVLLELRPDLVMPVPGDLSALAVRVQSRVSVARALDRLDQFTLEVLDALRLTRADDGTTAVAAVLALASAVPGGPEPAVVRRAVDQLRAHLLAYGPDDCVHVVPTVDEVSSPYLAGLGRPAAELGGEVAALCADPARLRRTLLAAPPTARAVLDRLAAGPPVGTVASGALSGGAPAGAPGDSPVRWLVDHNLLALARGAGVPPRGPGGSGPSTVELPREVGLLLRREAGPLGPLHPRPPDVAAPVRELGSVDSAGAGQAMEAVRQLATLLDTVADEPTPLLRSGGLGVRDLRRIAKSTGMTEPTAVLLIEVGHAAGLLGLADAAERAGRTEPRNGPSPLLLPTTAYDSWRHAPIAQRWTVLARAWLALAREPRLVGERDERDRPVPTLSPEAERAAAPAVRRATLDVFGALPPGSAPTPEEVLAVLAWRAPRRARAWAPGVAAVLTEAATLGLTGFGGLTSFARLLVSQRAPDPRDDDPLGVHAADKHADPPVAALDALLPPPVDHLLVQADLTVVVPGPPEPSLASELALVADCESAGGATVYRVTGASVRRAFDAGYPATDLHALFRRRSRTPVPQALTYLIDDVARRHGGLRAGSAGGYLRSDDEPLLAELLADRRLVGLGLRRLAPTVLVTRFPVTRLLAELRDAGYAPVPEDATGATLLSQPKARRAPGRGDPPRPAADPLGASRLTRPRLLGIAEQIRRADAATRAARRSPVTIRAANGQSAERLTAVQAHTQALAVLQQALRDKARVWVGYVDAQGATAQRLVRPVSIGSGFLRAEDERTDMLHTFALHRITAAVLEE